MSAADSRSPRMSAVKAALLAKRLRAQSADLAAIRAEPLAIVGMACRFPGGADHPEAFWNLLRDGVDAISEVPAERWNWRDYYDADPAAPGKMTTRWGGFIGQVDGFDAAFFGISPREALHLDPQQRLFLEVSYEALDDAGLPRERLAGSRTGVFVASYHNDYAQAQFAAPASIDAYTSTGTAHSVLANRLSYLLDFRGPSVSVDTACSSSLVAVHLACESLRSGESDVALVGGVSLMLTPEMTVALSKWGFLTEDGRCKTFDARANGFVRGEGCGVIVVKRLGDALADEDTVLALIRGSAVNQDGRSNALTAPSGLAQQAVVREALARAGAAPDEISYIEAHGTGTALGDPIEVEALAEVFAPRLTDQRCVIGSVKTNIGHTEAAAGLAGLIKVVLSLRHEAIPAHLHFTTPNPHLDFDRLPFEIPLVARPWPRGAAPRLAGVSSFGFGGTNAHAILEEAPLLPTRDSTSPQGPQAHILALSAQAPGALEELARRYRRILATPALDVGDVCYSSAVPRDHLDYRCAVAGASAAELATQLGSFLDGDGIANGASGRWVPGQRVGAAFVFSGQGPQWWAMGRELRASEPVFAAALDDCEAALRPHVPWSLLQELDRDETASRLNETQIAQPALFATQVALAALWRGWGVEPSVVIGHSVGEIAAAHVAGALTLETAARLVALRARIMQAATGLGRMAAIDLPQSAAERIAERSAGLLSIAAVNGPQSCVLSGDAAALAAALTTLTAQSVSHRMLPVNYAFHSAQMEPFERELVEALGPLSVSGLRCAMVSTVSGTKLEAPTLDATYWGRNLRRPVRFAAAVAVALELGVDTFVELSPHPVLAASIAATCEERGVVARVVASLRRGRPEGLTMRAAAAVLYANGASLDWHGLFPNGGRRVPLPSYPWQRRRYWQATAPTRAAVAARHPLAGRRIQSRSLAGPLFESRVSATAPAFLADHRVGGAVIVPATAQIEVVLAALGAPAAGRAAILSDLVLREPLLLPETGERLLQCVTAPSTTTSPGTAAPPMGFTFELLSAPSDQDELKPAAWVVHAAGSARSELVAKPTVVDLGHARVSCTQMADVADAYRSHAGRGLNFGPSFQGVRQLWRGKAQALGQIVAPAGCRGSKEFFCHPAVLDACLQVTLAALPEDAGLLLPFAIDTVTVYDRLPDTVWSHVMLRAVGQAAMSVADIVISDEAGRALVRIDGLRLARASLGRIQAGRSSRVAEWLYRTEWLPVDSQAGTVAPRPWLVIADESSAAADLRTLLKAQGASVVIATFGERFRQADGQWTLNAGSPDDFSRLLLESAPADGFAGIVHLCARRGPPQHADAAELSQSLLLGGGGAMHLFQALLKSGGATPPVWIVTRGARTVASGDDGLLNASTATEWGLCRSLAAEHPDLAVKLVDLDPRTTSVEPLVKELRTAAGAETEVAWRGAQRYAARLTRFVAHDPVRMASAEQPVRLVSNGSGLLEDLALQPLAPAPPAAGEVEIEVEVSGLNFRDVLNALGMYPGPAGPLGGECAGIVKSVGADVRRFVPGDSVMAFAPGAFASRIVVRESWVALRPRGFSAAQSAALPVAFLTARYALERLAQLRAGERVLIHAGAGGVGMAAIQLAHAAGAEVFATAGSIEKRTVLQRLGVAHVLDSRSLAFSDEIRRITAGAGVHVVLNALADDFIPASIAVLAPGGRFLEMGKRGIWSPEAMAAHRADVRYYPFDLGDAANADPALIPALFAALVQDFEAGRLQALPVSAWPLKEASAAFRAMAQARHIGKIVVAHAHGGSGFQVRPDASYLISGGLGALGMATARWLASHGARHLILLGRTEAKPRVRATLETLEREGVTIRTIAADVGDDAAMTTLFAELTSSSPVLRGIIHAAGVLDDGVLLQQSWARAARVLAPKALGGWLLARHARTLELDFFIGYSSATGVLASGGQGPYAMANACLDALCHQLRAAGVAAMAVQWGPWEEGGMATTLKAQDAARFSRQGVSSMPADAALAALEVAISAAVPEIAVLAVDWQSFAAASDGAQRRSFYAELAGPIAVSEPVTQKKQFIERYRAAPLSQRRVLLGEQIRSLALRSLGLDAQTAVEDARPLKDLGLDSLMAVELRNALSRSLGCPLPATLAFDYPSVTALVGYLVERLAEDRNEPGAKVSVATPAPSETSGAESLKDMSEDEAEAMLLAELGTRIAGAGGTS